MRSMRHAAATKRRTSTLRIGTAPVESPIRSPFPSPVGNTYHSTMRRLALALVLLPVLGCEDPFTFSGPPTVPVASVTIAPDSIVLIAGQQGRFTATPRDSTGAALGGRSIAWTTTDSNVAVVSATGAITARSGGSAGLVA